MVAVVGLDGCKGGWVAVVLENRDFADAAFIPTAAEAINTWPDLAVLAIDIPTGLPDDSVPYPRRADAEARKRLLKGRSSVFPTPPRAVLAEETYAAALARSPALMGVGLSRQAFALREKILEVDALARSEPRIHEVHPEISFRAMCGESVKAWYPKKTWNGVAQRWLCLAKAGIQVPDHLESASRVAADDVLDAAAAAWSARRIANGRAFTLPDPPQMSADGRPIAIWY